ncbi:hypothetical protein PPERSA_05249 [Pseudocohnilembus persalinus]|uniref:Uncharacterized protein n=1 Tax=Pseudocohnilembus persalinus TaxID=266149 RepID=A0A0V0QYC8_PSEPJ|nr:hypothetical protein PPERSA_05249 [Pseudocohnilembus persalinus]|eukprot:KRX07085.1 hypothetical protein PPERSA_05249 [Pseudocohnilembus persalinus]
MSQVDHQLFLNLNKSFNLTRDLNPNSNAKRFQRTRGFSLQGSSKIGNYQDSQPNTLRLAGKTAVFKGIQKNDLSMITGEKKLNLLPSIRQSSNFTKQIDDKKMINQTANSNLIALRKKFDHYKHQVQVAQKEFDLLSQESENLKKRESELESKMYNDKISDQYQNEARQAKQLFENSYWQYKSYQHMRNRLKQDMVSYQLRQNQIQNQIDIGETVLKNLEQETIKTQQFNHSTNVLMQNMLKEIEEQQRIRQKELEMYQSDHDQVILTSRLKQEQTIKQKEVSEQTMYDKDIQEKKWRQLYLVHLFVNQLFKAKMTRELSKFEIIEKTFQNIKQSTGVSDAQQIVEKFLTREQIYGELLASISEQEKKIENLEQTRDKQSKLLETLQQDNIDMDLNLKLKQPEEGKTNLNKKLEEVQEEVKLVDLYKEKLYYWCISTLIQIQKIHNQNEKNKHQQEYEDSLKKNQQNSQNSDQENEDEDEENSQNSSKQQQSQMQQPELQLTIPNFYQIYPREKFTELFQKTLSELKNLENDLNEEDLKKIQNKQHIIQSLNQKQSELLPENENQQTTNLKLKNKRVSTQRPKSQLFQNSSLYSQQNNDQSLYLQQNNNNNKNLFGNQLNRKNSTSSTESQDNYENQISQCNETEESNHIQYMRDAILREQMLKIKMKNLEEEKIKREQKAREQQY